MIDNLKIAIASGKGGTGKTLVATNLFYTLLHEKKRVTLVDCDAEEPDDLIFLGGKCLQSFDVVQKVPVIDKSRCTFCGKCYEYCNYGAIFFLPSVEEIRVLDDFCHSCGACSVACKFDAIREKDIITGTVSRYSIKNQVAVIEARMKVGIHSPVSVIKAAIGEAGNEGIILLDSPPGTSCPFIQTVAVADYVILVTEPTPFGMSDLKQSVEALRILNKPCGVVINRAGMGNGDVYKYLHDENLPLLMEIPFDRTIAMLYSEGKIVAAENSELYSGFLLMFNLVTREYGICIHQR